MCQENISHVFRLRNIDETKNYFLEEKSQNELMSKKYKKVCTTLNYIEHFLILASTITGCISISTFLIGIPIGITSSAIALKICGIAAEIKKYKAIVKKNKKKHDKTVLLAKSKLNSIEVLISKPLIDSVISNDEFVLINDILKEYNEMKEEIKILRLNQVFLRFYSIYKTMLLFCLKCRKNTESINPKVTRTKKGRIMLLSKCAVCDSKKSKFIKQQEASGLLCSLGIKAPLSNIPLVGPLLF